ncbi:MAG: hypothetical protein HGA80_09600 [Candidatus Omnitrophica bacterium]|nr:hypothetical protein [Candidatus Omnitrophota bacterium]
MSVQTFVEKQEDSLARSIFSVSATMVGVCFTVIGILNLMIDTTRKVTFVDDLTAWDALFFMGACIVSYVAMKTPERKRRLKLEKTADIVFLLGLGLMALIGFFIVYDINLYWHKI